MLDSVRCIYEKQQKSSIEDADGRFAEKYDFLTEEQLRLIRVEGAIACTEAGVSATIEPIDE